MHVIGTISVGVVGVAAALFAAPASAQQDAPQASVKCDRPVGAREQNTNQAMLAALLKRRAEVERLGTAESRHDALAFLDNRISQTNARIAACAKG